MVVHDCELKWDAKHWVAITFGQTAVSLVNL